MSLGSFSAVLTAIQPLAYTTFSAQSSQTGFDWALFLQSISPLITVSILAAVIAGIGFMLRSQIEHTREIERQLSEKKYNVYMTVMNKLEGLLHSKEDERKDNTHQLIAVSRELLFYGSDAVMDSYLEYLKLATSGEVYNNIDQLDSVTRENLNAQYEKVIGDVLLAIRRDMGNKNTRIKRNDLFWLFDMFIGE